MTQVNTILAEEVLITDNTINEYSTEFHNLVAANWLNLCCSLTISYALVCSQFKYRFAKCRPDTSYKDYWPVKFGTHRTLYLFVKNILWTYFVLNRSSFHVNCSVDLLIEPEDGSGRYLFSSRNNYNCFERATLIHNLDSFHNFMAKFRKYDLKKYVENSIAVLNEKYEGLVLPISLLVSCTRNISRVFGGMPVLMGVSRPLPMDKNCLFKAISPYFRLAGNKVSFFEPKTKGQRRSQYKGVNMKRALILRKQFLKWVIVNEQAVVLPFNKHGLFDSACLPLLEKYLKVNINIYSLHFHDAKRINAVGLLENIVNKGTIEQARQFIPEVKSRMRYSDTINLLSQENHILCVFDIDSLCGTVCGKCDRLFTRPLGFRDHKCNVTRHYLAGRNVNMFLDMHYELKQYNLDWVISSLPVYFIVHVGLDGKSFKLKLHEVNGDSSSLRYFHSHSMDQCVAFLLHYLTEISKHRLTLRMIDNLSLCADLDARLERMNSLDVSHERHVLGLERKSLSRLRNNLGHYLKFLKVYLISSSENHSVIESLMVALLGKLALIYGKCSLQTVFRQGHITTISAKGSRLEFSVANQITNTWLRKENIANVSSVLVEVIEMFFCEFGINFTLVNSLSQLGTYLLNRALIKAEIYAFYSPSEILWEQLNKMTRFGLVGCTKCKVGPLLKLKSVVSLDISKFYLSILKVAKIPIGIGLLYVKGDTGTFSTRPNRSHRVYANLLFSFLESILPDGFSLYFATKGHEIRDGLLEYPMDAILYYKNGKRQTINYDGCYWHAHFAQGTSSLVDPDNSNIACHLNPSAFHRDLCRICRTSDEQNSGSLCPKLFRLRAHENVNSPHPTRKNKSYQDVYEESIKKEIESFGNSDQQTSYVRIRECDIIDFFTLNLEAFAKKFSFPIKDAVKYLIFGEAMKLFCVKRFPLLRYANKIKTSGLIDLVRYGRIHGFLTFDGKFKKSGRDFLDCIKPFSFKIIQSGKEKTFNGYSGKEMCLPTPLLSFLLKEKRFEFTITKVWSFTEYHLTRPIFKETSTAILEVLQRNKHKVHFVKMLKEACNSFVGRQALSSFRYPTTRLIDRGEDFSLKKLDYLVSSTPINDDLTFLHFQNRKAVINLCHLNSWILGYGRMEMLRIVSLFKTFYIGCILQCNTDGMAIGTNSVIDLSKYSNNKSSLFLDFMLKPCILLNRQNILEYIDFKISLFKYCGFCTNHKNAYIMSLLQRKLYSAPSCCVNYENMFDRNFTLNLEFMADNGLFLSMNRYSLYNSQSNERMVKCSGKRDELLYEFESN